HSACQHCSGRGLYHENVYDDKRLAAWLRRRQFGRGQHSGPFYRLIEGLADTPFLAQVSETTRHCGFGRRTVRSISWSISLTRSHRSLTSLHPRLVRGILPPRAGCKEVTRAGEVVGHEFCKSDVSSCVGNAGAVKLKVKIFQPRPGEAS